MLVSNYRHDRWVVAGFLNAVQVKLDQSLPSLNQVTLRNLDIKVLALKHNRVDPDVDQHFRAGRSLQANRVASFKRDYHSNGTFEAGYS